MSNAEKISGRTAVPPYIMPDHSVPPYERIIHDLREYGHCLIGSSYFYILEENEHCCLCRIVYGGGRIYFHEIVDHHRHAISDEELRVSASNTGSLTLPGHYPVSRLIGQKLQMQYDR